MDFENFKDNAYSVWSAVFETLTNNGMDVKTAHDESRKLLLDVLTAYGSMEAAKHGE